jgi:hypothetical protein
MMPALRILVGVLVGVGLLVGVAALGREFPVAAPRIFAAVVGLGTGAGAVWFVSYCLRTGVTGGKFTRYERTTSPFLFWFYILFYSFLAACFLTFGISATVAPKILDL